MKEEAVPRSVAIFSTDWRMACASALRVSTSTLMEA